MKGVKVVYLSEDPVLRHFLSVCGDEVVPDGGDWIFSFGHRSIIPASVLEPYGVRCLNLHIGCLPWNRGAHPNYWAWKDGTPHGVTLHRLTERLDDGPIVAQRRLVFGPGFTFETSYMRLVEEARAMFMEFWPELRLERGSYHAAAWLPKEFDWKQDVV